MATTSVVAIRGVRKRFGAVQALAGVDLDVHAGEIHALLGENGAGKSTIMHVLAGVIEADTGEICIAGRPVRLRSPRQAQLLGIGMVHQHFALADGLTVAENLALAFTPRRWQFDPTAVAGQMDALAAEVGLQVAPAEAEIGTLSVGARQRLEILKALARGARVLILDEPTAVLTPVEVEQLFVMLRRQRERGVAIVFITHKLREVRAIADRVTIMRRGRVVTSAPLADLSDAEMAERMIGELPASAAGTRRQLGAVALAVAHLDCVGDRAELALSDVSFEVRSGEIFGIAGVDGNGQRELFEVLAGVRAPLRGSISVGPVRIGSFTPRAMKAAGIGHIPPDRQHDGLVAALSVRDNLVLSRTLLDRFSRRGWLDVAAVRQFAAERVGRFQIVCPSLDAPVSTLSGGNQQRVIVARELASSPAVLVAANPSRGLDMGAAAAVTAALRVLAREGAAVVLISTDLDEVMELSDDVCVLSRGRLSPPVAHPLEAERLGRLMAGAPPS